MISSYTAMDSSTLLSANRDMPSRVFDFAEAGSGVISVGSRMARGVVSSARRAIGAASIIVTTRGWRIALREVPAATTARPPSRVKTRTYPAYRGLKNTLGRVHCAGGYLAPAT